MASKRKHLLRHIVRIVAGAALAGAFLAELVGVFVEYNAGIGEGVHLFFAAIAALGAFLVFCNVRYSAYMVLPPALAIFFYDVYRTVSATISLYTVVSGILFFISALLCFMLVRAHKI